MLSRLRAGHGHWYHLADYMPLLNKAGYDAAAIENETGIERPRQNAWIVSAQVCHDCTPVARAHQRLVMHGHRPDAALCQLRIKWH